MGPLGQPRRHGVSGLHRTAARLPESKAQAVFETAGVTYLNVTAIHVAAAFQWLVSSA